MMSNIIDSIDTLNKNLSQAESVIQLLLADFVTTNGGFSLNPQLIENAFSVVLDTVKNAKLASDKLAEYIREGGNDE
ncbi:hypothetical protein [Pasteurella multocida]|uniref:hypothetical protein n=1 Tax=Pasteurella multocida TaxID=747 RepID=UPI00244920BE|nr:hypothetical protein [Pasteurella multocida]